MRITLNIDDGVLNAAMEFSEGRTRSEIVNEALRRFARGKRQRKLLDLCGKAPWEGNIDELRKRR